MASREGFTDHRAGIETPRFTFELPPPDEFETPAILAT
jgi:hypothetical protein